MYQNIGFKCAKASELSNVLVALKDKKLSLFDARIYLSSFEILARREAAQRKRLKRKPSSLLFSAAEFGVILGEPGEAKVRSSLRRLTRLGLLSFSKEKLLLTETVLFPDDSLTLELGRRASLARPIPLPRKLVKSLCRETRKSLFLTTLSYVLRGLSIDKTSLELRGRGTVKASWIANYLGLSVRAVRLARKELVEKHFIAKDTGSFQRKLNRDGSYFEINLSLFVSGQGKELAPNKESQLSLSADQTSQYTGTLRGSVYRHTRLHEADYQGRTAF